MNKTHLYRPGCAIEYMAHTKCGRTVKTLHITDGRPSCPDCYTIYFRKLMADHQAVAKLGATFAARQ